MSTSALFLSFSLYRYSFNEKFLENRRNSIPTKLEPEVSRNNPMAGVELKNGKRSRAPLEELGRRSNSKTHKKRENGIGLYGGD